MKPFGVVTKSGKVIREDILEQYAVKSVSRQLPPDTFHESYSSMGLIQPLYNPQALARLLEMNTYHYRACKTKARDTAGLGWEISPLSEDASDQSEAYRMVNEFFTNLNEPISTILDKACLDYEAVGYGAVELVRDNLGLPISLEHMPAHTLRMHKDGIRIVQIRGNQKRWFIVAGAGVDVNFETGVVSEQGSLPPEKRATEVLWIVNYTPRSDYYGLPDIIPALGAIHGDLARRDYNTAFFDNYGVPAYAVFITGNFDPGEEDESGKTELETAIEEHFKEMNKHPHSTLVMSIPTKGREDEVKIEFKPLATDVKEASFRLYRQDNRDEVLAAHGVPPYRLGIAETGSLGGSTAQESTEIYKRSVIEPRQETLQELLNKHVLWGGFEAYDWSFEFAEIDTSDEKHDIDMIKEMFNMGGITPNQIIRYFGERFGVEEVDHPAMDAHYINGQAIDMGVDVTSEIESALLSLQKKVMEVAKKDESSGSEPSHTKYLELLASIKTITATAVSSRNKVRDKAKKRIR